MFHATALPITTDLSASAILPGLRGGVALMCDFLFSICDRFKQQPQILLRALNTAKRVFEIALQRTGPALIQS
jgi:hypothetical protein